MNKPPELKVRLRQAVIILAASTVVAVAVNLLRSESLPWLAKALDEVETEDAAWLEKRGFGIISIALPQARQLFDAGVIFVDARPLETYREGHIQGALPNANFRELIYTIDQRQSRLEPVVLYCDGNDCQLSEELAYDLEAEGFLSLYVFSGGWDEWTEKGFPVQP